MKMSTTSLNEQPIYARDKLDGAYCWNTNDYRFTIFTVHNVGVEYFSQCELHEY